MSTIYLEQENVVLHRVYDHIQLTKKEKKIATIPLINVETLVLFNNCEITSPALSLLFEHNIDVIYTSKSGKIQSRLMAASKSNYELKLAQYKAFISNDERSKIAGNIVKAKIRNQARLIEKYKKYYSLKEYKQIIAQMNMYSNKVEGLQDINEIMGYEGMSARLFWNCYKTLLGNQAFTKRDYRPAPDYVNSALNLGYALLMTEISLCLTAENFDLELGFLHSPKNGRNSLALDLMEEFRTPFIDAWLLKLFNLGQLKEYDFKNEEEGFYLTSDGFKKFISLYHKHVESENWKKIFRAQTSLLKESILNGTTYKAFIWS